MKIVFCVILFFVLQTRSHCHENNVCKTIQDYYTIQNNPNCEYDVAADPDSDPTSIIQFYGYPAEIHKVTTLDGYILTMFRIPNDKSISKKGPVLMQHGLMGSAADYIMLGNQSLAFLLVNAGYDVWLGNCRGTKYSEGHVNLTVHDKQFWDFSADEVALYDIPAELNYISQATGHKGGVVYIGYSMGAGVGVLYSSAFPEQARETIKMLILLAPGAYAANTKAPLLRFPGPFFRPLYKLIMKNDLIRLVSQEKTLKSLTTTICFESPLLLQRCQQLTNWLFAGPQSQTDPKSLPVIFNQVPAGFSFKVFAQLADVLLGNFRRFDYGIGNFEKYGSLEPPRYEVGRIQVPVFIAHAVNDWAITPEDVRNLYNDLSPKVRHGRYEIRVPNFNHLDFVVGRNVKSIVYDVILNVLHKIQLQFNEYI